MKHTELNEFASLREKAGLTVAEVAELAGKTERTVYRWENGETDASKPLMELLKMQINLQAKTDHTREPAFTFIDLFAGIGGMRRGFEFAGGECVFTSEWNYHARKTYLANFACTHEIAGDITKVKPEAIPDHDVLVAGFPCQPFSIAGVSKKNALGVPHGFEDRTQGTLFFNIAKILDTKKPKAFLLENVKNLARHDKGRTFRVICETLDELGYTIDWRVIDAKGLVPQHRERVFIVGFLRDSGFSLQNLTIPKPEHGPRLSSILHPEDGSQPAEDPYTVGPKAEVAKKYILSEHLWRYLRNYAAKHKAKGNGFGYGLCTPDDVARTLSARYFKDGSEILIARGKNGRARPRRLTPRECARLMGFDRGTSSDFKIPVSDTQAYKQFGNAVAVPVIKRIADHMLPHILGQREGTTPVQLRMPLQVVRSAG